MSYFAVLYARPPPQISGCTPISINFAVVKLTAARCLQDKLT